MNIRNKYVGGLILIVQLLAFIVLVLKLSHTSYDVLSVTPLFLIRVHDFLMPITILTILASTIIFIMLGYRSLFILSSLILYFTVLYVPYNVFLFYVYNDQLGFALEVLSGLVRGHVIPYQGELATLSHAYYTTIIGQILKLNLFNSAYFVKALFVFVSFIGIGCL